MQVRVETVSRLHFGFLDLSGDLGRLYGSIGVALNNFHTVLEVENHNHLFIENGNKSKILPLIKNFSQYYRVTPKVKIKIEKNTPEHVGLGSGTQLTLAVSIALAKIYGINTDVRKLASIMGRGKRSGIGVACFEGGGFIIDSGRQNPFEGNVLYPPVLTYRHDFPEKWCFVIVIPELDVGFSGEKEDIALQRVNPSKKLSEEICRLVQIKLLPSLIEEDIVEFGKAITEIDKKNGIYFEKAQGGIYGKSVASRLIDYMLKLGAYGAGQSSWGPALYGLVEEIESMEFAEHLRVFLAKNEIKGDVFISKCSNIGAKVDVHGKQLFDS
jgi:beta-RFAP synthase